MVIRYKSNDINNSNSCKKCKSECDEELLKDSSLPTVDSASVSDVSRRSSSSDSTADDLDARRPLTPRFAWTPMLFYGALSLSLVLGAMWSSPRAIKILHFPDDHRGFKMQSLSWAPNFLQNSRIFGAVFFYASNIWHRDGFDLKEELSKKPSSDHERRICFKSCKLEIVESIPENITFAASESEKLSDKLDLLQTVSKSTFESWNELFRLAENHVYIAAYKSSLRGKHVLSAVESRSTAWGEQIFQTLLDLKQDKQLSMKMVENYPPRDKGDNEDGISLSNRGVIERRPLHYYGIFNTPGAMHSKFLIVDSTHFYLGSANFDWRSLNQKLELGVLVKDCPCLAADLKSIFDDYWFFASKSNESKSIKLDDRQKAVETLVNSRKNAANLVKINASAPLEIQYKGARALVYFAASPKQLNAKGRAFNLDAILGVINEARRFIYINVMDYVPIFLYRNPKKYWPIIDNALRRAVVERQVELKIMSAALHYIPQNLYFLQSLASLNDVTLNGSVQIKILRIPIITQLHTLIARDRRTHKKFMVTEDTVIIGTSNWVGDYFDSSTGVEIVLRQNSSKDSVEPYGPLVRDLRRIFIRDWRSNYAHPLKIYLKTCFPSNNTPSGSPPRTNHPICQPMRV